MTSSVDAQIEGAFSSDILAAAVCRALIEIAEIMPEPLDSQAIMRLIRLGHLEPERLSMNQIRKLCISIAAHNAKAGLVI